MNLKFKTIKKIILLLTISLFTITGLMAQAWTLNVSWNDSECDNCSDGYFEVVYTIYDNYNEVEIYTNEVKTGIALTENDVDIPVPLVEDNCDLESETYRPNYQIHATVCMYCEDSLISYEVICSGSGGDSDKTCFDFNYNTVDIGPITLLPVD